LTASGTLARLPGGLARAFRAVHGWYGRLGSPLRRVVLAGTPLLVAAVCAVVVNQGPGEATTEETPLAGHAVPADQLAQIKAAALSCPALNPARLAGQIMAISQFDVNARTGNGGAGLAGLTDGDWRQWSPWPGAKRPDPAANILALAHRMCDLVGQLRVAHVGGDVWRNALAASVGGVPAVVSAHGVPAGDPARFADKVGRYAAWYAPQPGFNGAQPEDGVSAAPLEAAAPTTPASAGAPAVPPDAAGPPALPGAGAPAAGYGPGGVPAAAAPAGPAQRRQPAPQQQAPPPPPPAPVAKPVVNLALHRPVVASSFQDTRFKPYQNFPAYLAVDGNGGTRWSSLAENPSWIYVDLGAVHNVVGARLLWETASSKNYEVRVSNDGNNWITVYQDTNGNGGTDEVTFTPVNVRYVKMYSVERNLTAYGVSLWEFQVLGT
jgi:hypothetical protein